MVDQFIRSISGWPASDRRDIALALVRKLSVSELAEVLAAAHQRIHKEAEKRKPSNDKSRSRLSKTP